SERAAIARRCHGVMPRGRPAVMAITPGRGHAAMPTRTRRGAGRGIAPHHQDGQERVPGAEPPHQNGREAATGRYADAVTSSNAYWNRWRGRSTGSGAHGAGAAEETPDRRLADSHVAREHARAPVGARHAPTT